MTAASVRALLESRRAALAKRLAAHEVPSLEDGHRATGLTGGDVDGAAVVARDLAFAERERLLREHRQVLDALARIAAGEYGRCIECGAPIAPKRLAAVPWVERCLGCQERRERDTRVVRVRSVDEEDDEEAPEP